MKQINLLFALLLFSTVSIFAQTDTEFEFGIDGRDETLQYGFGCLFMFE